MRNEIAKKLMAAHKEPFATEYDHRELLKLGALEIEKLERCCDRLNRRMAERIDMVVQLREIVRLARTWILGEKFPKQQRPEPLEMTERLDRALEASDPTTDLV